MLENMKSNGLILSSKVRKFHAMIDEILVLPKNEQHEKLHKLIENSEYNIAFRKAVSYVDTTFNITDFYVTILAFASSTFVNASGLPIIHIGAIMLSSKKEKDDFVWMGHKLVKLLDTIGISPNLVFWYKLTT